MLDHAPRPKTPDQHREVHDLNATYLDRQQYARQEHDQWMKDHPDFASREMLDHWASIRQAWGLGPKGRILRKLP